uniref:Uncharacterized protein n=2 Tax=Arundo donax TaxID=35708 RepID=A0A0A8XU33_ARUDO
MYYLDASFTSGLMARTSSARGYIDSLIRRQIVIRINHLSIGCHLHQNAPPMTDDVKREASHQRVRNMSVFVTGNIYSGVAHEI